MAGGNLNSSPAIFAGIECPVWLIVVFNPGSFARCLRSASARLDSKKNNSE